MDESQMHHAKWKKLDIKGYMLYDFIYMTLQKRLNYKTEQWLPWNRSEGKYWLQKNKNFFWGGVMKIFCIFIVVVVTWLCICQKSQNCKLKRVNFTICKLYKNLTEKEKLTSRFKFIFTKGGGNMVGYFNSGSFEK